MIERIRTKLVAAVPPGYSVTEKRTQYWMDDDSAAYCDIAVSGGGREFSLIVLLGDANATARNEFFARVWLHFAPEIWIVIEDQGRVLRATQDAPELVEVDDQLVPVAIAGVRFNVGELRGSPG